MTIFPDADEQWLVRVGLYGCPQPLLHALQIMRERLDEQTYQLIEADLLQSLEQHYNLPGEVTGAILEHFGLEVEALRHQRKAFFKGE